MERERRMVFEAVSLSERFPDLSDFDVLEHINFVYRRNVRENTVLGQAILIAYATQNKSRGLDFLYPKWRAESETRS
jgi:hypothetical protein